MDPNQMQPASMSLASGLSSEPVQLQEEWLNTGITQACVRWKFILDAHSGLCLVTLQCLAP